MAQLLAFILALCVSTAAAAEGLPAAAPKQIGRLAALSGAVSIDRGSGAPASGDLVNYPLTSGDRIATPPRGHATVDIAAGRFYLGGDSALKLGPLGPDRSRVVLEKGAVILRILPGGAGQVFEIETPRGTLRADQPGYFEVALGAGSAGASFTALQGGAQLDEATVLPQGTRADAADGAAPVLAAAAEDDFTRRIRAEIADAGEDRDEAPTHVSPQATGFQELQRYGLWVSTEDHGWVWEPTVASDWAPFGDGRWAEIAPWGRTWIDAAPWAFATSHYGSWTEVNGRWAWVPGDAGATPAAAGAQSRGAHWVALGPEEPHFAVSPVIVNRVIVSPPAEPKVVNVTTVNNTTNVTNVVKEDRRPSVVFINGTPPSPPPNPQPPTRVGPNLTGLGAAGTPIGPGVAFPGQP